MICKGLCNGKAPSEWLVAHGCSGCAFGQYVCNAFGRLLPCQHAEPQKKCACAWLRIAVGCWPAEPRSASATFQASVLSIKLLTHTGIRQQLILLCARSLYKPIVFVDIGKKADLVLMSDEHDRLSPAHETAKILPNNCMSRRCTSLGAWTCVSCFHAAAAAADQILSSSTEALTMPALVTKLKSCISCCREGLPRPAVLYQNLQYPDIDFVQILAVLSSFMVCCCRGALPRRSPGCPATQPSMSRSSCPWAAGGR